MNIYRYKQLVNNTLLNENEDRLRLLGQGKCARIMKEDYGKKNIFPQQILKLYENDIGPDLVFYHSQETIVMIEDLHQQTGYADVNKQGRKNPI